MRVGCIIILSPFPFDVNKKLNSKILLYDIARIPVHIVCVRWERQKMGTSCTNDKHRKTVLYTLHTENAFFYIIRLHHSCTIIIVDDKSIICISYIVIVKKKKKVIK